MHIPDGFLSAPVAATTAVLAAAGLGLALRRATAGLSPRRVPLLGVGAAFIFAAQMLNFPVLGGTSGHLLGGALAAVLLGPSGAAIALAAVLVVQCLLFADGGITALGANIFNMALVAPLVAAAVYAPARQRAVPRWAAIAAAMAGAWLSTVAAALACAGQLAWSGLAPWGIVAPAMGGIHALIGIGEAAITGLVVWSLARLRPELLARPAAAATTPAAGGGRGNLIASGLLVALGLAIFVAPFACPWPDGLEHVAENIGFAPRAVAEPALPAPLPDYAMPGFRSAGLATAAAGAAGTLALFGLLWAGAALAARLPVSRRRPTPDRAADA